MKTKKDGRKKSHSRPDWDGIQIKLMEWCLRVKLAQHYRAFFLKLLAGRPPVPSWSCPGKIDSRARFGKRMVFCVERTGWGSCLSSCARGDQAGFSGRAGRLLRVEPLEIPEFRLLGKNIGVVDAPEASGLGKPPSVTFKVGAGLAGGRLA